jgi:methyltransferase-like protein
MSTNFVKQTLLDVEAQRDINTVILCDFNTSFSITPNRKVIQTNKSNKDTLELNGIQTKWT